MNTRAKPATLRGRSPVLGDLAWTVQFQFCFLFTFSTKKKLDWNWKALNIQQSNQRWWSLLYVFSPFIAALPGISSLTKTDPAIQGQPLVIRCDTVGTPEPNVLWKFNVSCLLYRFSIGQSCWHLVKVGFLTNFLWPNRAAAHYQVASTWQTIEDAWQQNLQTRIRLARTNAWHRVHLALKPRIFLSWCSVSIRVSTPVSESYQSAWFLMCLQTVSIVCIFCQCLQLWLESVVTQWGIKVKLWSCPVERLAFQHQASHGWRMVSQYKRRTMAAFHFLRQPCWEFCSRPVVTLRLIPVALKAPLDLTSSTSMFKSEVNSLSAFWRFCVGRCGKFVAIETLCLRLVHFAEIPRAPTLTSAVPVSTTSISLTWRPAQQTLTNQITYYIIQYKLKWVLNNFLDGTCSLFTRVKDNNDIHWFCHFRTAAGYQRYPYDILGSLTSHEVDNLKPYTDYLFKVAASNDLGYGQFSNVLGARTLETGIAG